jgi:hypothetical protein
MGGTSDPVEMCGYFMYQIHLGGTSDPLGGDIRSTWGGHQIHLGGTSDPQTPLNAAEN